MDALRKTFRRLLLPRKERLRRLKIEENRGDSVSSVPEALKAETLQCLSRTDEKRTFDEEAQFVFGSEVVEEEDVDLEEDVLLRRNEILNVLRRVDILSNEDERWVRDNPRRSSPGSEGFDNRIRLPEWCTTPCFADYLNASCKSGEDLERFLLRPIRVAVNDAPKFTGVFPATANVKDAVVAGVPAVFYSFCLDRMVFFHDTHHCPRCGTCQDGNLEHCDNCDQCSFGLKFGTCEHCSENSSKKVSKFAAASCDNLSDLSTSSENAAASDGSWSGYGSGISFEPTRSCEDVIGREDSLLEEFDSKSANF